MCCIKVQICFLMSEIFAFIFLSFFSGCFRGFYIVVQITAESYIDFFLLYGQRCGLVTREIDGICPLNIKHFGSLGRLLSKPRQSLGRINFSISILIMVYARKVFLFLLSHVFLTLSEAAAMCLHISSIWKVRKCDCVYNS